jgi:hypothetical protein
MKNIAREYEIKCVLAAFAAAALTMAAALKPYQFFSTGLLLAGLVLLSISLFYAELYEQVKHEQRFHFRR